MNKKKKFRLELNAKLRYGKCWFWCLVNSNVDYYLAWYREMKNIHNFKVV